MTLCTLEHTVSIPSPEYEDSMFIRKFSVYIRVYTASQPGRKTLPFYEQTYIFHCTNITMYIVSRTAHFACCNMHAVQTVGIFIVCNILLSKIVFGKTGIRNLHQCSRHFVVREKVWFINLVYFDVCVFSVIWRRWRVLKYAKDDGIMIECPLGYPQRLMKGHICDISAWVEAD
jgi:hypothetical protein